MSATFTFVVVEVPVVTTVAFAGVAWLIQRMVKRVDDLTKQSAENSTDLAGHELRITAVEVIVHDLSRKMPQVSENLAVVAGFVERHERWHERHPDGSHNTPSS